MRICSRCRALYQKVLEALEKLVSKEILLEKEMRYCFPVNLPRKWIAARFPLKKVLASGGQGGSFRENRPV